MTPGQVGCYRTWQAALPSPGTILSEQVPLEGQQSLYTRLSKAQVPSGSQLPHLKLHHRTHFLALREQTGFLLMGPFGVVSGAEERSYPYTLDGRHMLLYSRKDILFD